MYCYLVLSNHGITISKILKRITREDAVPRNLVERYFPRFACEISFTIVSRKYSTEWTSNASNRVAFAGETPRFRDSAVSNAKGKASLGDGTEKFFVHPCGKRELAEILSVFAVPYRGFRYRLRFDNHLERLNVSVISETNISFAFHEDVDFIRNNWWQNRIKI